MKIAISGPPGSGKTTQAKRIAEEFSLKYYSAGSIFRKIAEERGLSLEELSEIAARDPSIDLEIDRRTYELAQSDNIVLDGHLTAWIAKDMVDFKIYVTAPLTVRVLRIAARDNKPLEAALRETLRREELQRRRFIEFYGLDPADLSFFDLVLDTSRLSPDEAFGIIRGVLEKALKLPRALSQKR